MKKTTFIMTMLLLLIAHQGFATAIPDNVKGRALIVLVTPQGSNDPYYGEFYDDIVDFQISYAKRIAGHDNVIIIAPEGEVYDRVSCTLPRHVLKGRVNDIWMRDIAAARQKNPILFQYWPNYIEPSSLRDKIRNTYLDVLAQYGIDSEDLILSNIILDGGNFVDNGLDTVVMTSRVYEDNPQFSPVEIKNQLKQETEYKYVAIVEELDGDTTGHSDGMVSFIDEKVLALGDLGELNYEYRQSLLAQIASDIKLVTIPNKYKNEQWRSFTSACGVHLNALTTTDYVYVPTFGHDPKNQQQGRPYSKAWDDTVVNMIKANTEKTVISVPVPHNVCRMGGSVRCLSWQVEGEIADTLVEAAANLKSIAGCK
jgi:agmatine/peptidylarginine deiminase